MRRHQRWHAKERVFLAKMVRLNFALCSPRGTKYVILIVGIAHELAFEVFADGLPTALTFVGFTRYNWY